MKNIVIKSIIAAVGVVVTIGMTSCEDKFLTEVNPNEISTGSYWLTIADLEGGLVGVYNAFKNESIYKVVPETNRSDMDWPGWGRPNTGNEFFLQTFTSSSNDINQKWAALYEGIFKANQVIEAYERINGTFASDEAQERADQINAEARFFRGLFHFYLHNSFNNGKVIIYDFVPKTVGDFYQSISSADKVEEFYRADLEFALENLPPKWIENIHIGRVTAGAAEAVLGKSYLYAGDYTTAAAYFKNVIENPEYGYSLVPDIGMNFHSSSEFNAESILEVSYSIQFKSEVSKWDKENTANNLPQTLAPAGYIGGFRNIYPACWLIMEYKEEKMDLNDASNYAIARDWDGSPLQAKDGTDSVRLRLYSKRTVKSIALPDDRDELYYLAYPSQKGQFNNGETSYWKKFTNSDVADTERTFTADGRGGSNFRLIRLADVYLMYAECLIKGGTDNAGVDEAMRFINAVRKRSALELIGPNGSGDYPSATHDNVTYDAASLMDHLMYVERPLELSLEGHAIRFLDLRRWGIIKERFEELAVGLYTNQDFPYVDLDGKPQTKWGSVLVRVATAAEAHARYVDRAQPANNFNPEIHSYYPIPNSEETGNPNLYNETN